MAGVFGKASSYNNGKAISSLVLTMKNIKDFVIPWYFSFLAWVTFERLDFKVAFFIDVLVEFALPR